jgi:hypothetical protein
MGKQFETPPGPNLLDEFMGQVVVIDLDSPFVCMGTLQAIDALFFDIRDADLHDLRDTRTSRENYVAASCATGIKRNRKRVLVARSSIVAVSLFRDIVDE